MGATIRPAARADIEALARLRWLMDLEDAPPADDYDLFLAAFQEFATAALNSPSWQVWVADTGTELVGTAWLEVVARVPRPSRQGKTYLGYLTNVFVEKSTRNQGIGTRLLREVVAWSGANGLSLIVVWPSERASAFYGRSGFTTSHAMQYGLFKT